MKKLVRPHRRVGSKDVVSVASIDNAIRTLKEAKKASGKKYVVVKNFDGGVIFKVTDSDTVMRISQPTVRQMKPLKLKVKIPSKVVHLASSYRVEESGETISAIKENLKSYSENNRDFLSKLNLDVLKR